MKRIRSVLKNPNHRKSFQDKVLRAGNTLSGGPYNTLFLLMSKKNYNQTSSNQGKTRLISKFYFDINDVTTSHMEI